jgi:3-methylcrotonyl-CoA carboxylase alpha subunit
LTVTDEALAEAALASYFQRAASREASAISCSPSWLQTDSDFQPRTFNFQRADAETGPGKTPETMSVSVQRLSPGTFEVTVNNQVWSVTASYDSLTKTLTTYFPHTRHTSRVVIPPPERLNPTVGAPIHLFSPQGSFRLVPAAPAWLAKALGTTEKANSLLSPMPAKILRVHVAPGDVVKKDQILLVIESMKMETVIRSPGEDLTVKRVVHGEGETVGSGVELVEFEAPEE